MALEPKPEVGRQTLYRGELKINQPGTIGLLIIQTLYKFSFCTFIIICIRIINIFKTYVMLEYTLFISWRPQAKKELAHVPEKDIIQSRATTHPLLKYC